MEENVRGKCDNWEESSLIGWYNEKEAFSFIFEEILPLFGLPLEKYKR